jgi:hypothetical protein
MERQLFAKRKDLDFVASMDTIRYDCLLSCDSMAFDFDMGRDLWLTKSRFTILQRDYLDLYNLETFLRRCKDIGTGASKRGVITQLFAKQHAMREKKYRWGNCMLGWDFRGGTRDQPPTLTMHSRVSYVAYIGGLDLALCHVLAREIGKKVGAEPEEFAFRWTDPTPIPGVQERRVPPRRPPRGAQSRPAASERMRLLRGRVCVPLWVLGVLLINSLLWLVPRWIDTATWVWNRL